MAYSANRYAVTFNVGSDTKKVEMYAEDDTKARARVLQLFPDATSITPSTSTAFELWLYFHAFLQYFEGKELLSTSEYSLALISFAIMSSSDKTHCSDGITTRQKPSDPL